MWGLELTQEEVERPGEALHGLVWGFGGVKGGGRVCAQSGCLGDGSTGYADPSRMQRT